jgi:hypothetical protein
VADLVLPDASFLAPLECLRARINLFGDVNPLRRLSEATENAGGATSRFAEASIRAAEAGTRFAEAVVAAQEIAKTAIGAIGGVVSVFNRRFITPAAEMERFRLTLEVLQGSAAGADSALQRVRDFTAGTPFSTAEVTRAFIAMRGEGIDPTRQLLAAAGDAAAGMNASYADAAAAITAAAGGNFDPLKRFGITGRRDGDNTVLRWRQGGAEMTRSVRADDSAAVLGATADALGGRFAGATARLSTTWSGMLAELSGAWNRFAEMVMASGVMGWLEGRLASLLDWISRMQRDGSLQRWASETGQAIIQVLQAIERFLLGTDEVPGALQRIQDVARTVRDVLSPLVDIFGGVGLACGALALVIVGPVVASLAVLTAAVWGLGVALLTTPVGWIVGGLVLIGAAAYAVWRYWTPIKDFFAGLLRTVDRVLTMLNPAWPVTRDATARFFSHAPPPDPATVQGPPDPRRHGTLRLRQPLYAPLEDAPDEAAPPAAAAPATAPRPQRNALPRLPYYPALDTLDQALLAPALGAAAALPAAASILTTGAATQRVETGGVLRISVSDDRITLAGRADDPSMRYELGLGDLTP